MSYVVVPQPRPLNGIGCLCGAMGTNGDSGSPVVNAATSVITFSNFAKVALVVAAASILWRVFSKRTSMQSNMLTPWADIGPLFAKSLALGPAFALTHYL
jgi:hypothetical protein